MMAAQPSADVRFWPWLFVAFLGTLAVLDVWMIIDPRRFVRWTMRWSEWGNAISRPLMGIETRVVDQDRNAQFNRAWAIIYLGLIALGLVVITVSSRKSPAG